MMWRQLFMLSSYKVCTRLCQRLLPSKMQGKKGHNSALLHLGTRLLVPILGLTIRAPGHVFFLQSSRQVSAHLGLARQRHQPVPSQKSANGTVKNYHRVDSRPKIYARIQVLCGTRLLSSLASQHSPPHKIHTSSGMGIRYQGT